MAVPAIDYAALGFKAGLEIHQQLDTPKLFCRCPPRLDEDVDARALRSLKPTQSELGEVDPAALAEARKKLLFAYEASHDTSCLVELDEEPPHEMSPEAVETALEVALLLNARPVDEVHVMRKIVIDGSNTSGFQRTALYALDGRVDSTHGPVAIDTLALEEDSARKEKREGNVQGYRLDRLGIPLVEIATAPGIKGPEHAQEVALAIGMALRATGKVKRGIGTIRQDLNVSIRDGARIELKGVQELRLIPVAIEFEVLRQLKLIEVRDALRERGGDGLLERVRSAEPAEVSTLFANAEAKVVKGALKAKGVVLALPLPGFSGLLGKKTAGTGDEPPEPRFGRELADYAKVRAGVKGIFQSDEMPAYGITAEDAAAVACHLGLGEKDAFALVAAPRAQATAALEAVRDRAVLAFSGVPEETRDAHDDGSSAYLRPLPGGARMYPETDVPPVRMTRERVDAVRSNLPELLPEKEARLKREYADVSAEQIQTLVRAGEGDRFELLARETGLTKEAARVLVNTIPELASEGVPSDGVSDEHILAALKAVKEGAFAKEAVPAVLKRLATEGGTVEAAAESLGLGRVDVAEVERSVDKVIHEHAEFVQEKGPAAIGPLMGPLMQQFRGQVPGKELSRILKERIHAFLEKT